MKVKFELDITPEEVLELFEGNAENLQKTMLEYFMKSLPQTKTQSNDIVKFWQLMTEKSQEMFEQYKTAVPGASNTSNAKDKPKTTSK